MGNTTKMVLVVIGGIFLYAMLAEPPDEPKRSSTAQAREAQARESEANLPDSFISTRDDIDAVAEAARRCVAALHGGSGGVACDSFDAKYAGIAKDLESNHESLKAEWESDVSASEMSRLDAQLRTMQRRVSEVGDLRNPWSTHQGTSRIDDSPTVTLRARSNEHVTNWLGRPTAPATLTLSCLENTTRIFVNLNDNHMSSSPYHDWGHVTMRIDDQQAFTNRMQESTDNSVLGLWSGGQSIPVIRRMFGAERLTVRATPYGQSPITVTFDITGLEDEIQPLRQACNW
ncbi:type VI secretion system-associated protein TagO [Billgrantia sp. LNSP4103-1]|uniref:type VI secretion system-associated protein TagO n=1 Tax=Billgrantia sp. LNSP4103-1 TaxID=3410266 RepID=UPI00403F4C20